jgi:hypothetical protein
MNMVIDRDVLAKVLAAEPVIGIAPDVLSKMVVKALEEETLAPKSARLVSDPGVYSMALKDLARKLALETTPARVGRMVGQLGLRSLRTRAGYQVYWNLSQLVLLKNALGV